MISYCFEDKKKIAFFVKWLKACQSVSQQITLLCSKQSGLLAMQNQDSLNHLDSSCLVFMCWFKNEYFSQTKYIDTLNCSFEIDIQSILRSLKSLAKITRRMTITIDTGDDTRNAMFKMMIITDDGNLLIDREIFINEELNLGLYFKEIKDFTQDKNKCLEIKNDYLKHIKKMKDNMIELLFLENLIQFRAMGSSDHQINISKDAFSRYDYRILDEYYEKRNKLMIQSNFLLPQTSLAMKLNKDIEISFSEETQQNKVNVFVRTSYDHLEIVSCFVSSFDQNHIDAHNEMMQENPHLNQNQNNQTETIHTTGAQLINDGTSGGDHFQFMSGSQQNPTILPQFQIQQSLPILKTGVNNYSKSQFPQVHQQQQQINQQHQQLSIRSNPLPQQNQIFRHDNHMTINSNANSRTGSSSFQGPSNPITRISGSLVSGSNQIVDVDMEIENQIQKRQANTLQTTGTSFYPSNTSSSNQIGLKQNYQLNGYINQDNSNNTTNYQVPQFQNNPQKTSKNFDSFIMQEYTNQNRSIFQKKKEALNREGIQVATQSSLDPSNSIFNPNFSKKDNPNKDASNPNTTTVKNQKKIPFQL